MRKHAAVICMFTFVLFISVAAYPSDGSQANFSISEAKDGFSLSKSYEVNISNFELNSLKVRDALLSSQSQRKNESIQAEIKHLKKRRTTNWLVSAGLVTLGTLILYDYTQYETSSRESQEGGTQDVDEGRSNTSSAKGIRIAGFGACYLVSVILITDAFKKSKAIKQYKKELEALAKAQGR